MHNERITQSGREYHFFPVSVLHYLQQTSWQVFFIQTHTFPPRNCCTITVVLNKYHWETEWLNCLFSELNNLEQRAGSPRKVLTALRELLADISVISNENNQQRNLCCQQICPCVGPWGVNTASRARQRWMGRAFQQTTSWKSWMIHF